MDTSSTKYDEERGGEEEVEEIDNSFKAQFSNSLKINDNLSGIYLWLLFGFLSVYVNCDLQRFLRNNPVVLHLVGLYTFFFLFTSLDSNNKAGLFVTWIKTFVIYVLFLLTTKSKWYFAVSVLLLLLVDKSYKYYVEQNKRMWNNEKRESLAKFQEALTYWLTFSIIAIIFIGVIHYIYLQKIEYKSKFSYWTFFMERGNCKKVAPKYY